MLGRPWRSHVAIAKWRPHDRRGSPVAPKIDSQLLANLFWPVTGCVFYALHWKSMLTPCIQRFQGEGAAPCARQRCYLAESTLQSVVHAVCDARPSSRITSCVLRSRVNSRKRFRCILPVHCQPDGGRRCELAGRLGLGRAFDLIDRSIHVLGLGTVGQHAAGASSRVYEHRHRTLAFAVVVGTTTLLASCLHAFEATIWAVAYWLLGALRDSRSAMLYSLNALTS
jgi:hypothetical protein